MSDKVTFIKLEAPRQGVESFDSIISFYIY